jgi:peptidoglycan/xylan/chitin deacetylase (PgdA/CDA1 family)
LDKDELQKEIGDTSNALKEITGADVMAMRAPYGDMDTETWLRSGGFLSAAYIWTHDSLDWELPGADAIVANCTADMAPGSVILMHDGGGERDQDVEALPRVIEAWQKEGYKFVTLDELLASDSSINMEAIRAGAMPEDAVWPTELA